MHIDQHKKCKSMFLVKITSQHFFQISKQPSQNFEYSYPDFMLVPSTLSNAVVILSSILQEQLPASVSCAPVMINFNFFPSTSDFNLFPSMVSSWPFFSHVTLMLVLDGSQVRVAVSFSMTVTSRSPRINSTGSSIKVSTVKS